MSSSKFWGAKFWVTKHSMGESEMLITNGNLSSNQSINQAIKQSLLIIIYQTSANQDQPNLSTHPNSKIHPKNQRTYLKTI
jgi:hypothetical protein